MLLFNFCVIHGANRTGHMFTGDGSGDIGNRLLSLSYGTTGTQVVNDTVLNWRNVAPCGN